MTRSTRAVTAAALGAALLASAMWLVPQRPSAPVAAAELAQRNRISSCTGQVRGDVVTDTMLLCEQSSIVVDAAPSCSSCPGGLNVVFVQVTEAFHADWQNDAAIAVLNHLDKIRSMTVRVAVIHYDSRIVATRLRLTDQVSRARGPLNQPRLGHDPHGDFVGAAREALSILRNSRRDIERQGLPTPCEAIVFFASTKSAFPADEQKMLDAAQMIKSDRVPLFVGCPESNVSDYCRTTRKMPTKTGWYAEVPDTRKLASAMAGQTRSLESDVGVRTFMLTQLIPPGLEVESGSIDPVPAEITGSSGTTTTLKWEWRNPAARQPQTVTFKLNPLQTGVWPVDGEMQVTDLDGIKAKVVMAQQMITVTGPCIRPSETPMPSDTPEPSPTSTPEPPPTPTATDLPPTVTPTPEPQPIYLPVSLREPACKNLERHADVVLVIDMSTSMNRQSVDGAQKKATVIEAAKTFVSRLDLTPNEDGHSDHAAIVGFNDDAWVQLELTNDGQAIVHALDTLDARQAEGTRLDLAFLKGAEALQSGLRTTQNMAVLIMLTDGLPNRVPADPTTGRVEDTVIQAAQVAKNMGANVYTIGFGKPSGDDIIDRVYPELLAACASNPSMAYIEPRADRMAAIYGEIASVFTCPKGRHDWSLPWP